MKAVILSAGQGSRLLPLTENRPKCLLPLDEMSVLDWQIHELARAGIREIVVVAGFRSELVEQHLAGLDHPDVLVRCRFNPFYKVADNLSTCWMVRDEMDGDFLVLNGDTVFEAEVAQRLIAEAAGPVTVTIDRKDLYDADDMKVRLEGARLLEIGKSIAPDDTDAESIGMLLFSGEGPALFRDELEAVMRTPEGLGWWYLKAIDRLGRDGHVGTVSIEGLDWGEIDYPADLEAARRMVARWTAEAANARKVKTAG